MSRLVVGKQGNGTPHRNHDDVVYLLNSKPVEKVGHQSLEPHVRVLHQFGGLEVLVGGIASSFAEVVTDQVSRLKWVYFIAYVGYEKGTKAY
jgi:hypothetical protein